MPSERDKTRENPYESPSVADKQQRNSPSFGLFDLLILVVIVAMVTAILVPMFVRT